MLPAGADFEVAFDDAKVDGGVAGHRERGLRFHDVVGVEDELEFLLVDGRRGQQGGLQAVLEPHRRQAFGFIEVFLRFLGMLHAGHHAVAQCDDAVDDVPFAKRESAGNLLVGEPHPAAVQADGLGQQDQFLPEIANLFFGFLVFCAGHHQVVLNTGELAVFP